MPLRRKTIIVDNDSKNKLFTTGNLKSLVAVVILCLGIFGAYIITKTAPKAQPSAKVDNTVSVETIAISSQNISIPIELTGITEAADIRQISSNINGSVIEINPAFEDNSFIKKGQWLLKVENSQLAPELSQAKAQSTAAGAAYNTALLTTKHNNAALLELGIVGTENPPQLIEARARLEAAQQQLKTMEERAGKSEMIAPFDARILKRLANVSDLIAVGVPLAQTLSSDKLRARLAIADAELNLLDKASFTQGAELAVTISDASGQSQWQGVINDLEIGSALNNQFNYLITEIYDPFQSSDESNNNAQLTVGSSVKATLASTILNNVFKIPLSAVHNGNQVWIYNNAKLDIKRINIVYRGEEFIYTDSELSNGQQIIISSINLPVDGMKLNKAQTKK